jgi:hypothetical protein
MKVKPRTFGCGLVILAVVVAGCGGNDFVSVTGTVTYDGTALDTGTVTFSPASGQGPNGYGSIQSNGSYEVKTGTSDGLPPGEYKVTVHAAGPPPPPTPENPEPIPESLIPMRYRSASTSGLSYTVTASGGTYDIKLTSN